MDIDFGPEHTDFADEVRTWFAEHLKGEFAAHRGVGSPTDNSAWDVRIAWEKELSAGGWLGLTWPREYGGRGASLSEEIIFEYEYARCAAPARVNQQALELLGPTVLDFGTEEQKRRFIPAILSVDEIWGQGFSEPTAGSDLAAVSTKARLDGDQWVINGQKVWTTFGDKADWLYVLCRTDPDVSRRHRGLTLLLVPADQPGVEIRPITNLADSGEFAECFFTDARTDASMVLGEVNGGWKVVMSTLGRERGSALIPVQMAMERELAALVEQVKQSGSACDPRLADRIAASYASVAILRARALRVVESAMNGDDVAAATAVTTKVFASHAHQTLGELAMDVAGDAGAVTSGPGVEGLDFAQRLFLLSRAETIYGGTSEIQRNIIAERALGLPK